MTSNEWYMHIRTISFLKKELASWAESRLLYICYVFHLSKDILYLSYISVITYFISHKYPLPLSMISIIDEQKQMIHEKIGQSTIEEVKNKSLAASPLFSWCLQFV